MCTIFLSCSVLPAKLSLREVKDGPTSVLTAASADFDKGENGVALVISMFFPVVFVIFYSPAKEEKNTTLLKKSPNSKGQVRQRLRKTR